MTASRCRPGVGTGTSRRRISRAGLAACLAATVACGTTGDGAFRPSGDAPVLVIAGFQATPARVQVAAGGTLLVLDRDPVQHALQSATAPGTYAPGAVNGVSFTTPPFSATESVGIPASAPIGTVVPWFCLLHPGAPGDQGEIEVVAPR